jgi:hypothetical protein
MNIWMLVFTNIGTERAVGPFTAIAFEIARMVDTLTGRTIAAQDISGWFIETGPRRDRLHFDRIVIQSERPDEPGVAPWGTRGV